MRQLVAALSAGLVFALTIPASQSQTAPDTTSAWRYYPLAIGDVWEYWGSGMSPGNFRIRIVGDTVVGSTRYFKRVWDGVYCGEIWSQGESLVRFDTALALPRFALPNGSGVEWGTGLECPLNAAFGIVAECLYSTHRVTGKRDTLAQLANEKHIQDVTLKQFWGSGGVREEYVADVGLVSDFLVLEPGGKQLVYARVGGVEYGTPGLTVSEEPNESPATRLRVRVLGNPVRHEARFEIITSPARSARWTVTDALGRTVQSAHLVLATGSQRIKVPTNELATGVYRFSVLSAESRESVPFTVVR